MKTKFILLLFFATWVMVACKTKKNIPNTSTQIAKETTAVEIKKEIECANKVTFETLKPLLSKSCTTPGCHGSDSFYMNFTQYAIIKKYAVEGEIRKHVLEIKNMPPNEKLSNLELTQIKCWLEGGMLEK